MLCPLLCLLQEILGSTPQKSLSRIYIPGKSLKQMKVYCQNNNGGLKRAPLKHSWKRSAPSRASGRSGRRAVKRRIQMIADKPDVLCAVNLTFK